MMTRDGNIDDHEHDHDHNYFDDDDPHLQAATVVPNLQLATRHHKECLTIVG